MITGLGSARDLASGKKGAFYNTLEEFHKYWERIDIIAPKISRGSTSGGFEVEPLFGNVYIHISPWSLIFYPFWFLKKALEIYKENRFNLMTVHDFPPFYNGIGARLLWHKIRAPYVLEFHHVPGYPKAANLKEKIYAKPILWRLYWKFFGSKTRAIRVVNQKQTLEFLKSVDMPEEKIIYIPSVYLDLDVFKPLDLEKKYDLILVGRLEENKGIELLLKAIQFLVYGLRFPVKCLIVGDGSLSTSLRFKVKGLNLENNVIFYGRAKDSQEIVMLMNKSKALVMTSYNEGGPRVVLEAMACGVRVLATPVGIVPDLLKNGPGGEIIAWEADDITRKAKGLLNNPERYGECRFNGLETAKRFEKKEAIKNYAEKLKSIL